MESTRKRHDGQSFGKLIGVEVVVFPFALEGIGYNPVDVIQRKAFAHLNDGLCGHPRDAKIAEHHLDVVAVLRHRAVREPFPKRLVCGLPLHFKWKEPAFRLVDGEYAHPLRVDPLEPQQFPISMFQYHACAPFLPCG